MRYLVFGAAGSIGKAVVLKLRDAGHFVVANSGRRHREAALVQGVMNDILDDVANRLEMENYTQRLSKNDKIDGIIYSVGHCPPNGFSEAIKYPLSQLPLENYVREINMHQIGVLNTFQCMLPVLADDGSFVFISSAITRLKGHFPPFLQAHGYTSAISAEDWLVEGMRHDSVTTKRRIKVHRLAPVAVDSPFFGDHKPPEMIPISKVVDEVVLALASQEIVDKQIL